MRAAWVRQHCFDTAGNYLYHRRCIAGAFPGTHGRRTDNARETHGRRTGNARETHGHPQNQTYHSLGISNSTFSRARQNVLAQNTEGWNHLRIFGPSAAAKKQFTKLKQHGLVGKPSNRAKPLAVACEFFKAFILQNRVSTGRTKGKRFRLVSDFTSIKANTSAASDVTHANEKSVEFHFNMALKALVDANVLETSVTQVCGTTVQRWWNIMFAKNTELSAHPTDYCDTCATLMNKIVSIRQQIQMKQVRDCLLLMLANFVIFRDMAWSLHCSLKHNCNKLLSS